MSAGVGVWSIAWAARRVGRYPERGTAHRLFAVSMLGLVASLTACLLLFLGVGAVAVGMEDSVARTSSLRLMIFSAVAILSALGVAVPVGFAYIEARSLAERRGIEERHAGSEEAHEKRHEDARGSEAEHQRRHDEEET